MWEAKHCALKCAVETRCEVCIDFQPPVHHKVTLNASSDGVYSSHTDVSSDGKTDPGTAGAKFICISELSVTV